MNTRYFKIEFVVPMHPITKTVHWSTGRKRPFEQPNLDMHSKLGSEVSSHLPILGSSGCSRGWQTSCQFISIYNRKNKIYCYILIEVHFILK